MRLETRTVRIGEWLGPVDWSYDFEGQSNTSSDPDRNRKAAAMMREVEEGLARGERWAVYAYGTEREVLRVGMYDGWPSWSPTPSYDTKTWMGLEAMGWYGPQSVWRLPDPDIYEPPPDVPGGTGHEEAGRRVDSEVCLDGRANERRLRKDP